MTIYSHHSTPYPPKRVRIRKVLYAGVSEARQEAICEDYKSGVPIRDIVKVHRTRNNVVYAILDKHGIERRIEQSDAESDLFTFAESRLIDSLRNGVSLKVACELARVSESNGEKIQARAKRACRL